MGRLYLSERECVPMDVTWQACKCTHEFAARFSVGMYTCANVSVGVHV